jgi:hypothetical protein
MSEWQMAQAATFTCICPALTGAKVTSSITRDFPNSRHTAAFIRSLLFGHNDLFLVIIHKKSDIGLSGNPDATSQLTLLHTIRRKDSIKQNALQYPILR